MSDTPADPLAPPLKAETLAALLISDVQAATLAGISRSTLHSMRAAGKFGPVGLKLSRCLRFRKSEIEAWILANCPDARTWAAMQGAAGRRLKIV